MLDWLYTKVFGGTEKQKNDAAAEPSTDGGVNAKDSATATMARDSMKADATSHEVAESPAIAIASPELHAKSLKTSGPESPKTEPESSDSSTDSSKDQDEDLAEAEEHGDAEASNGKRNGVSKVSETAKKQKNSTVKEVVDDEHLVWDEMFGRLVKFTQAYHHTRVPCLYVDAELARWVEAERVAFRRRNDGGKITNLTDARIQKLDGINFDWTDTQEHESANVGVGAS